jgi:hypothetical protein
LILANKLPLHPTKFKSTGALLASLLLIGFFSYATLTGRCPATLRATQLILARGHLGLAHLAIVEVLQRTLAFLTPTLG